MKTPNTDLFDLIRSMNKNEKRFFQLFASLQSGEKNYLKLFSVIENQIQYDEVEIKKIFKGETFIRQLTFTKEYLYQTIIKSLNQYHLRSSVDATIMEYLQTAKMLYARALFKQCHKVLNKARQLASIHDKYALLLEILDIEKKLLVHASNLQSSEKELEKILQEEMNSMEHLSDLCKYWHLNSVFQRVTTRNWRPRSKREFEPLEEIIKTPLLKEKKKPAGFESTFYYYFIFGMYSYFKKDTKKAHHYLQEAVNLLETRPEYIQENLKRYMSSLYNLILTHLQANDYKKAQQMLERMKHYFKGKKVDPDLEVTLFNNYTICSLNIFLNTGEFEKGVALIEETKNEFERFGKMISDEAKLVFCFNASLLFFITEDYRRALQWLNRIYDMGNAFTLRIDLNCFIRIFDLFIHFELDNHVLLEYKVKSVYRFLYKRNRVYKFETLALNFIKKYSQIKTKEQGLTLFKKTRETIVELSKDPFEREVLDRFDFLAWLDSRIKNRPFKELVKERLHSSSL